MTIRLRRRKLPIHLHQSGAGPLPGSGVSYRTKAPGGSWWSGPFIPGRQSVYRGGRSKAAEAAETWRSTGVVWQNLTLDRFSISVSTVKGLFGALLTEISQKLQDNHILSNSPFNWSRLMDATEQFNNGCSASVFVRHALKQLIGETSLKKKIE